MPRVVWIVAPLFWVALPAPAEIFKCAAKDGVVVYQNFRCELDSLGSLPSTSTKAPVVEQTKPTNVALGTTADQPKEPRVGMTAEDVRAVWGEPTDTFNEEPGNGGRTETWVFGSDRSVRFDHRSRVIAIQKQGG